MDTFVRDDYSKAIINTNTDAIAARRQYKQLKARVEALEKEIATLKSELHTLISSRG